MEQESVKKRKKTIGLWQAVAIVAVVGVAAFIVGTRSSNVYVWLSNSQNKDTAQDLDFASVEEVYDKLREHYDGKLDVAKLIGGAKKGMVEATGDPYTVFFTDEEAKQFLGDLEGKFSGIGAELDKRNNQLVIVSTLDDSPARKAGLQPNDAIAEVNDEDAATWSVEKAVSKIRGEQGTTVKLGVVRNQQFQEISIVRAEIVNPSVKSEVTAENIGYLRISRFAENDTVSLATKAAQEFRDKNVKGVVLDLRGNGGGYLNAAQDIASLWLNDKVVVQERRGDKVIDTLRSGRSPILEGVPTVVLVDGGSASASEIVAGALNDNGAAKLIGEKTFGKGSVQQIEILPGGGQLKVTVAKWYTPNGKNISQEGIKPGTEVKLSEEDARAGRDPQKDRAFEQVTGR